MSTTTAQQFVQKAEPEGYLPKEPLFLDALANRNVAELARRFEEDGYVLIKGFLSDPLLSVAYRYLWLNLQTGRGNWDDAKVPGTLSLYGDCLLESILELATPAVEQITSKKLWPTFAHGRLNKHGDVLTRHRDLSACEISATLSLGHDVRAVRTIKPDYVWPIFMDGNPVACAPGDMVIFKACEVLHWREAFEGRTQAQVSMHYIDRDRKDAESYRWDSRPSLGLPAASADAFRQVWPQELAAIQELCFSSSNLSLELLNLRAQRSGTNSE
jgi:hypothetical protein